MLTTVKISGGMDEMSELERKSVIGSLAEYCNFRYVAPFQNHSALKATVVENRGQISDFLTRC